MDKVNILVCDDEKDIVSALEIYLTADGYQVFTAYNGRQAVDILNKEEIHLVLMDIMMPEMNGISAMVKIREKSNVPVILLTAKSEDTDKILGLTVGADDYVIKPFRTRELISRINSVLRRYHKDDEEKTIKCGNIKIDVDKAIVYLDDREIVFTSLEYKILLLLFSNKNILVTREQILDKIWDVAGNFVNDNTLTVYIKRIREKLDDKDGKIIQTVRGIGYKVVEKC